MHSQLSVWQLRNQPLQTVFAAALSNSKHHVHGAIGAVQGKATWTINATKKLHSIVGIAKGYAAQALPQEGAREIPTEEDWHIHAIHGGDAENLGLAANGPQVHSCYFQALICLTMYLCISSSMTMISACDYPGNNPKQPNAAVPSPRARL